MVRIFSGAWVFVVLGAGIGGCTNSSIGSGPLQLSPKAQTHYQEYKNRSEPGAFVVSENGGAYYSYCPTTSCMGAIMTAMRLCRNANAGKCYIYDIDGQIVWRFDEPPPATARAKYVPGEPLIHCMLRGSDILTTEARCLGDGGTLRQN
jgi:hypothetical protein